MAGEYRNGRDRGPVARPSVRADQGRHAAKRGGSPVGMAVVAIVAVAVVVGAGALVLGGQNVGTERSQDAAPASAQAAAPGGAAPQAPAGGAEPASPDAPAPADAQAAPADAGDLSWRDSDFAVNPDRTDWTFADNGRKTVYLTIDDGPSDKTREVLDILDRYGCKATFFVVGHDPDHYSMIREAYDRGHTIGLHTYTHDYAEVYSSVDAYFADLDAIGQVVADQIGYVPCFIRFPGGSSNAISANYTQGIMTELVGQVQSRGYQYWDWNVSCGDGSEHTADELVYYATEGEHEENIVLLCHDSATKQATADALPRIIEYYQGLGYSFEALTRDSWVCHHGVSN